MATSSKIPKETNKTVKVSTKQTKAPKKISDLPPFATLPGPMMMGNQQYIPEPRSEEERRIYESQVLIPITVSGKNHVLFGPLPNLNIDSSRLRDFFPTYHKCKPIVQAKKLRAEKATTTEESQSLTDETIDLRFMNNSFRVFRATTSFKDPTDYLNWLSKIEKTKSQTWKDMGIYDLIMLSKVELDYSSTLLVSSL